MAIWNTVNLSYVINKNRIDSEFYKVYDVELEKRLKYICKGKRLKDVVIEISERFDKNSVKYFQYNDIGNTDLTNGSIATNIIESNNAPGRAVFINREDDILISSVRPNRNANAIVNKNNLVQVGSNGFCNVRSKGEINPNYIFIYTKTKYFIDSLVRATTSSMYPAVSNKDILNTYFFIPEQKEIQEISDNIKKARSLLIQSQSLYQQATKLLEKELGLNNITFDNPKSYTARFSEVISNRRMNAEYYSPLVKAILQQPFLENSRPIASLFKIIRGNTPKKYLTKGVPVIKTKNIRLPEIDRERISDYVANIKDLTNIQENDLLLAAMGVGSLGRISFIQELEQDYVVDGTIRVLRRKNETPDNYEIPTLLFLSSKVGQKLIYRGIVGSTGIISLPDDYLFKIPIPSFEPKLCYQLTQLVKKSISAKKQSKQLLAQAKARVEELIEQAAKGK